MASRPLSSITTIPTSTTFVFHVYVRKELLNAEPPSYASQLFRLDLLEGVPGFDRVW